MEKIRQNSIPLGEYVKGKIYRGVVTGLNEVFIIDQSTRDHLIAEDPKSAELIKSCLLGKDIKRYGIDYQNLYMIFTRRGTNIKDYPAIHDYLLKFKDKLMPRPKKWAGKDWKGRKPGPYQWFEIQDSIAYYEEFEKPKIIWGNLAQKPKFAMDTDGYYINAPGVIIPVEDYYLLGIMNSSLFYTFISEVAAGRRGGFFEYKPIYVSQMPIHQINIKDPKEVENRYSLIQLVKRRIELEKKSTPTPRQKEQKRIEIEIIESAIDSLVCELYQINRVSLKD